MRRRIFIIGRVRPSVRPSVRLSRPIFRRVLGASCTVYPALFSWLWNLSLRNCLSEKNPAIFPHSHYQTGLCFYAAGLLGILGVVHDSKCIFVCSLCFYLPIILLLAAAGALSHTIRRVSKWLSFLCFNLALNNLSMNNFALYFHLPIIFLSPLHIHSLPPPWTPSLPTTTIYRRFRWSLHHVWRRL